MTNPPQTNNTPPPTRKPSSVWFGGLLILVGLGFVAWVGLPDDRQATTHEGTATEPPPALSVYCAHDSVYSEAILKQFQADTGIPINIKFDSEATKSLGLVELIAREADNPRCDVFWNNELLGTLDLHRRNLLHPYKGSGHARIPAGYKDPDGYWTGFAARLRVWIVNTDKHDTTLNAINTTLASADLRNVTIAKPLFGTTRTHYTVMWHLLGSEKLAQWHQDVRARGLVEAASNGQTMRLVAAGKCAIGWTDTDDYFVAKDAGDPVAMVPARIEGDRTICIPNTVAIIKGSPRIAQAQVLVDYLLSAKIELQLAQSKARQIPLGDVNESKLPSDVGELRQWADKGYDLTALGDASAECLAWLKSEYLH